MPTFAHLATTFIDFLTVAIHTILYERGIYPPETFLSARKYHYAVRQNRHPRVCEWIQAATSAVETELLKGTIARVALVIFSSSSEPLERFLFDLSNLPAIPTDQIHTPFERSKASSGPRQPGNDKSASSSNGSNTILSVNLEEQFRAVMARLSTCGSQLGPLPPDCTYTVVIENKRNAQPPISRPQPWIPVDPKFQVDQDDQEAIKSDSDVKEGNSRSKSTQSSNLDDTKTLPIRAVKDGEMIVEVWVEEGKHKRASLTRTSSGQS